jgi:hypothetical protein
MALTRSAVPSLFGGNASGAPPVHDRDSMGEIIGASANNHSEMYTRQDNCIADGAVAGDCSAMAGPELMHDRYFATLEQLSAERLLEISTASGEENTLPPGVFADGSVVNPNYLPGACPSASRALSIGMPRDGFHTATVAPPDVSGMPTGSTRDRMMPIAGHANDGYSHPHLNAPAPQTARPASRLDLAPRTGPHWSPQ